MTYDALKVHIEYIRLALERGEKRMERIEQKLDSRPCLGGQGPCPTQSAAPLPPPQEPSGASQDAMIGGAVRWTLGKAWTALPHVWRTIIVLCGGATLGGFSWPGIKFMLLSVINHL